MYAVQMFLIYEALLQVTMVYLREAIFSEKSRHCFCAEVFILNYLAVIKVNLVGQEKTIWVKMLN